MKQASGYQVAAALEGFLVMISKRVAGGYISFLLLRDKVPHTQQLKTILNY